MSWISRRGTTLVVAAALACAAGGLAPARGAMAATPRAAPPTATPGASPIATPPTPIPEDPFGDHVRAFLGHPRPARPVPEGTAPPRNPYMAANGRSELHDDAYQSDNYLTTGPLGYAPKVTSAFFAQECASLAFDRRGRILTVCVGPVHPTLRLMDPRTLATLASYPLPPRNPATASHLFTSFGGGGYLYLDRRDQVVVPTSEGTIEVIGETAGPARPQLVLRHTYDLTSATGGKPILSALPDWSGRLWFVTTAGLVGTVDRTTGAARVTHLPPGETIGNSFAVDQTGGVFIVSDRALYRFDSGPGGRPQMTWRRAYDAGIRQKPGQSEYGSGTTPTLMEHGGQEYVAITDNADPRMHVLVYHAGRSGPGRSAVCDLPVFSPGRSDTDNSLVAFDSSLIVENNYGYTGPERRPDPSAPMRPTPTTTPGVARVDVHYAHGGCHLAWDNTNVRVPSSVSKSSVAAGLLYVYAHPAPNEIAYRGGAPPTGPEDPWYLSALDLRTGRQVWSVLTGVGLGYNNNYAPVTVGPHGAAYIGVLGGLVRVADT